MFATHICLMNSAMSVEPVIRNRCGIEVHNKRNLVLNMHKIYFKRVVNNAFFPNVCYTITI